MEHDQSDDQWGFWEPERTRRLPRVRAAERAPRDDVAATPQLGVVGHRRRQHGAAPEIAAPASSAGRRSITPHDARQQALDASAHDLDPADPLGLFDELGPVDEFPELDRMGDVA